MRPNILIINPDQMRSDALHHLGNEAAYTPNIDALINDGVSYENAFCQNPVCVPSRCSFMTGQYSHTNGHRTMGYLLRRGEKNLFEEMKNGGYYVWSSGRGDLLAGQDKKWLKICADKIYNKCGGDRPKDEGRGDKNSARYFSFYKGEMFSKNSDGIVHDNDFVWTKGLEDFIKNNKGDKPFFAFLGLMNPHPPYRCEKKYLDLIDESKIKMPISPSGKDDKKPSMEVALREELHTDGLTEEEYKKIRKTYLAMCAKVDDYTGRIIKALKDSGQYDNTAIFFFSDHGDFTGDFGLVEKAQNLFPDCLVNVPFIVKPPKGYKTDCGINSNLVELVDFYATAVEFAHITPEHTHFGKSLINSIADKSEAHRKYAFCEGGRLKGESHCTEQVENYFGVKADEYEPRISVQQRETGEHTKAVMIRSRDYKYIMRLYEQDEFYVLKKGENINEIDNPEYAQTISQMRDEILNWYFETCDAVPFEQDSRFPDEFFLEEANAFAHFKVSPIIKTAMKLTRSDFSTLVSKAIKLAKIDTNKFH